MTGKNVVFMKMTRMIMENLVERKYPSPFRVTFTHYFLLFHKILNVNGRHEWKRKVRLG